MLWWFCSSFCPGARVAEAPGSRAGAVSPAYLPSFVQIARQEPRDVINDKFNWDSHRQFSEMLFFTYTCPGYVVNMEWRFVLKFLEGEFAPNTFP